MRFLQTCKAYRVDECMGEWKPFHQIVGDSLQRTLHRFGLEYRESDGRAVYEEIPTWGPYPGVTQALTPGRGLPPGDRDELR